MLEHAYGKGRVFTCLTAAGPLLTPAGDQWNNWANGPPSPSYAVFQLDLAKHIARRDRALPVQTVGEPLCIAYEACTTRILADADNNAVPGSPWAGDGAGLHLRKQFFVNLRGSAAERKLT